MKDPEKRQVPQRLGRWIAAAMIAAFCAAASAGPAMAQDGADANYVVVFDASGSMWGQIDGTAKIDIARAAFDAAQRDLAGAANGVGLVAYGHRRKGDCADIEVIVDPATGSLSTVAAAVSGLTPKGKTPLSDALRQAARLMRHVEDRATVVLFSDGVETCNADPCAVASELEQAGLDFTAHVIGFDITASADRAQLACIAEKTGGLYRDAANAGDVAAALSEIGSAVSDQASASTVPAAGVIAFQIVLDVAEDTFRPDTVSFKATNADTGDTRFLGRMTGAEEVVAGLAVALPQGAWTVTAVSDEGRGAADIAVTGETGVVRVPFAARQAHFSLLDNGPYALGVAHYFFLNAETTLQANAEYTVGLAPAGGGPADMLDFEYRFGSDSAGMTAHDFEPPATAGAYEVLVTQGDTVLERFPVSYTADATPRWKGATRGQPGETLALNITGNLYYYNQIALRKDGQVAAETSVDGAFSPDGWGLTLPQDAGVYDLTYRYDGADGPTTVTLTQIVVGDVVLPDDPDAVAPPADAGRAPATDAAATSATGPEVDFQCQQPACLYDGSRVSLPSVPIHNGFGIANEARNDAGRITFDLVNLATGDLIMLNPPFMVNTMDCFGITEDGRRAGDDDQPLDQLCLTQGSTVDTIAQFESLEAWRAGENQTAFDAALAQDRAAHDATMGEDMIFTAASLETAWTLSTLEGFAPVGIISFDLSGEDPSAVKAYLTLYPTDETRLAAEQTVQLTASVLTTDTTELIGFIANDASDLRVGLQFARPPAWDGQENLFHGLLVIAGTGAALKVEMF